jgi:hypothetical protein
MAQKVNDVATILTGGPQYNTTYAPDGTATRTKIPVSTAHLGLALALEVLQGGMAGMSAHGPAGVGEAAKLGMEQGAKQAAAIKQRNIDNDATAKADQDHKLAVAETNMRNYQTQINVGKSSLAASQANSDSWKDLAEGVENGTTALPPGVSPSDRMSGKEAMADISKNGGITKNFAMPIGDPKPVIGANGQQEVVNGIPHFESDFIVLHGVTPDSKIPLDEKAQKAYVDAGLMKDIPEGGIGHPMWSLANIGQMSAKLAAINSGEQILQDHRDDATQLLGHAGTGGKDGKGVEGSLDDLKAAVKSDPNFRKAVSTFSQAQQGTQGANGHLEDILNSMGQRDPRSRGMLMNYMGLSEKDLDDMHNKRTANAAEAGAEGKGEAVNPDSMGKALSLLNNPDATKAQKTQAQGVIDGFNKQEKLKADNAADAAQAKEDYKQQLKDQRTMGYVEDQKGDVYHVSQWQADHMPNYSAQTFIEKKPSDISADQKAIKPINDIQNNINGYRAANNAYEVAAKGNKVDVNKDRSNLTTIFSAPAITNAAEAHGGVEGFGISIPTLAADLNKDLATKILTAYNGLSPEGKEMADSYARMRGAIPAYVKVITNAGRGSKEQLDIELQNIMPPYFNQADIRNRTEKFQGNLDTQKAGFPKNLAGSHFVPTSGVQSAPQFRRDPQTKAVQQSNDGGKSWQ